MSSYEERKLTNKILALEEKLNKLIDNQMRDSTLPKFGTFEELTGSKETSQPPWIKKDRRVNAGGDLRKKRKKSDIN